MAEDKKTHDVVVRKDIALANGESLRDFTQKARDQGTKWVRQKLNLVKDASVYPIEIFSKSMVFDVAQYGPNVDQTKRYRFFAASYTRKSGGDFEFGSLTEVERVTSFRAKESAPVMKSADGDQISEAEAADRVEGWQTKKSLFAGVI